MSTAASVAGDRAHGGDTSLASERDRLRLNLLTANAEIWTSGPSAAPTSLDSSLKRNSTFIKRVRQGNIGDGKDALLRDVDALNLGKYLDELVPSLPELLWRSTTVKDRLAAIELISALHRRYGTEAFTVPLSEGVAAQLIPPNQAALQELSTEQRERDESARIARQRVLVRGATELALTGLAGAGVQELGVEPVAAMGHDWLYTTLRTLLATDRDHANVGILVHVLKSFSAHLLAPAPLHEAGESFEAEKDAQTSLVSPTAKARFRKLFETYYATFARRIQRDHDRLLRQEERNRDAYIRSGEVFEDRQQTFDRQSKELEKLNEAAKTLSEYLSVKLPELAGASKMQGTRLGVNLDAKSTLAEMGAKIEQELASGQSPWEDEETRFFYTDVCDLKEIVPASLLKDSSVAPTDTDAETSDAVNAPAQVQALLARLPSLASRTMIDEAAVELALCNTRTMRVRLVKSLLAVPRERRDLLPYYARLAATVHPYMPDVTSGLLSGLDAEFRQLHRRRSNDTGTALARARNIVFLGELVKFGIVAEHTIFFCLKTLVDDFSAPAIEVLATFLETCGRYLVRTPATAERMHGVLQLVQRKRSAHHMDSRVALLLDNAYYQCIPPPRVAIQREEQSVLQQFIVHLFGTMLSKNSVDRVTQLLRRLDWEDEEVRASLFARFTRPWELKFHLVHLLAHMMRALYPMHTNFFVPVLDHVCEAIHQGLEHNHYQENQRRIALVYYLGELYNYRVVNSNVIMDHLWLFCMDRTADGPQDYFRIGLVCTLLDACGACFDTGLARRRMDEFLVVFRLYVQRKAKPLPADMAYQLRHTLESLRPKLVWREKEEEAVERKVETILPFYQRRLLKTVAEGTAKEESDDEESDNFSDDEDEDGPRRRRRGSDAEAPMQSAEDIEAQERERQAAQDREAELELDNELAQLMAESSTGSGGAMPAPLPQQGFMQAPKPSDASSDYMVFSLLSRRGNRPQSQDVHVPSDNVLSVHTRQQLEEEAKERRQLKAYVLAYRDRELQD